MVAKGLSTSSNLLWSPSQKKRKQFLVGLSRVLGRMLIGPDLGRIPDNEPNTMGLRMESYSQALVP